MRGYWLHVVIAAFVVAAFLAAFWSEYFTRHPRRRQSWARPGRRTWFF
jgi:hypothetical protein